MSKRNAVNRNYKSSIFTMLFSDRKELLGLYNAISGKQYKDPSLLEINTLENAIYMAVRNDLSFVIDSRLSLYEHQSTYSPNLPLRMLMYLADLYAEMTRDEKLYGRKKVLIRRLSSSFSITGRRSSRTGRSCGCQTCTEWKRRSISWSWRQ